MTNWWARIGVDVAFFLAAPVLVRFTVKAALLGLFPQAPDRWLGWPSLVLMWVVFWCMGFWGFRPSTVAMNWWERRQERKRIDEADV